MVDAPMRTRSPIFLCVTGSGAGGIATLVLDGEELASLLQPFFKAKRSLFDCVSGDLLFGRLIDQSGRTVDEIIAAPLGKKSSATGNEQIELSCHGGLGVLSAVEEILLHAGFERGSETALLERAHLNGKLSLIAIEARLLLAQAVTARQADLLLSHSNLQSEWERLGFDMAMEMPKGGIAWREKMFAAADNALAQARPAQQLLRYHHVAILGSVNAGKSTLANALAQSERHIVSDIPGTTRDRLDVPIDLRGLNVLLSDTAGLRATDEDIEREGQKRARDAARAADLRILLVDGSQAPAESDTEWLSEAAALGPCLLVLNKRDLGVSDDAIGLGFIAGRDPICISALTGAGMDELSNSIESALLFLQKQAGETPALQSGAPFTSRQEKLLSEIRRGLGLGFAPMELLPLVRRLVGTRPDPDELAAVLALELENAR